MTVRRRLPKAVAYGAIGLAYGAIGFVLAVILLS
jgi:hypothetical protein